MLEIILFKPSHLADIDPPDLLREPMRRFAMAYCDRGPALTFVEDGRVLGCFGLILDGRQARVWGFLSSLLRGRPATLHRMVKGALPKLKRHYGLDMILAEAHPDHAPSWRWLERLGFRFNGVAQRCPIAGERHLRYLY
ncbi:GNAT family N-acetyltransferase [Pelagibius sp.]|uniref:GNAT family N-acetyltransferase n=1 Tax=Pelagibius sp. TaxID=1931238 RepID=UPI003B5023E7